MYRKGCVLFISYRLPSKVRVSSRIRLPAYSRTLVDAFEHESDHIIALVTAVSAQPTTTALGGLFSASLPHEIVSTATTTTFLYASLRFDGLLLF